MYQLMSWTAKPGRGSRGLSQRACPHLPRAVAARPLPVHLLAFGTEWIASVYPDSLQYLYRPDGGGKVCSAVGHRNCPRTSSKMVTSPLTPLWGCSLHYRVRGVWPRGLPDAVALPSLWSRHGSSSPERKYHSNLLFRVLIKRRHIVPAPGAGCCHLCPPASPISPSFFPAVAHP